MSDERDTLLNKWAPMPRYLLRRWVVRRIIRSLKPNDFIEIGAATGEMAQWMSDQSMKGVAVEISPSALELLQARLDNDENVSIFSEDARQLDQPTDLLLSMEVIEHIEDDSQALRDWYDLVRPGGYLLLSAPAGRRLFSAEDEMVGHFRRYEKTELREKIKAAGFDEPEMLSYGFPLGLALKHVRNFIAKRKLRNDRRSKQERTEASGVERHCLWLRWMLNDFFFLPFNLVQMPFLKLDCTDGYIAVARKPATPNQ